MELNLGMERKVADCHRLQNSLIRQSLFASIRTNPQHRRNTFVSIELLRVTCHLDHRPFHTFQAKIHWILNGKGVQVTPLSANSEGLFTQKNPCTPPKNPKNPKKIKKIQGLFLRILNPYTLFRSEPPFVLKPFLFIKSSYTQKNPGKNPEKIPKPEKNPKNPTKSKDFFLRI